MDTKKTKKYPAEEVEYLLAIAQNKQDELEYPSEMEWMKSMTAVEARNELLLRFQSLITSLIDVCHKGKYFTSYSKKFLSMFARKGVPLQNVATVLKKELAVYDKEELRQIGQLSIMVAIENCKSNLASAILFEFKTQIAALIQKEAKSYLITEVNEDYLADGDLGEDLAWTLFMASLSEKEHEIAVKIIDGKKVGEKSIPKSLKIKLANYLGMPL